MQIGILKTGQPPTDLGTKVPSYPDMIRHALGSVYSYREFDVAHGSTPDSSAAVDAYVITGSASGVYDGDPWIERLRVWLMALDPNIPLIGICFGHQIMAEAYGGAVRKSDRGWIGGLQRYVIDTHLCWMDAIDSVVLPSAHQDQVVSAPLASRVIATSDRCPIAAISYSHRRAVSFQGHPEFSNNYASLLIDYHERVGLIGRAEATLARESFQLPTDCDRVAGWIHRFLAGGEKDVLPR